MSPLEVAQPARVDIPASDPHDRALVRHLLTLTPSQRLDNVSAYWPLMKVGLERRAVTGARRP